LENRPITVAGIDPGIKGAVAFLDHDDKPKLHRMPVLKVSASKQEIDMVGLAAILSSYQPSLVVLERVHALPKQGTVSMFRFGRTFGRIEGLCVIYKCLLVAPQEWKRVILNGTDRSKEAAVAFCSSRWPELSLTPAGCKTPHHGLAEALAMAEYGRRLLNGTR
jgi:hypothetical protein